MANTFDLDKYIHDFEMSGLKGRYVKAPASNPAAKNVNILVIHGHHSSHERLQGVIELLTEYGNVCVPDMPGFGGMSSLFSVGEKPSVDRLADYMAAFVKLHYGKRKKFVVVGYSMGFLVATKLLQKYPQLHPQVLDIISVAGLVHYDDISFSKNRKLFYHISANIVGTPLAAYLTKAIFLRKWFLGTIYTRLHNAKDKFGNLDKQSVKKMVDFEVGLWRANDVRTWCYTTKEMLTADLLTGQKQLPFNLISVTVKNDRYFDTATTEQHLNIAYQKVVSITADLEQHGGSRIETAAEAAGFLPAKVRKHLRSLR